MKYLKLLFIVLVIIAAIVGIFMIPRPEPVPEPDFTSDAANEWKTKINELCEDWNWSVSGYHKIESGIHTDNVVSGGALLSNDEEDILRRYLFSMSCSALWNLADGHFKESTYDGTKIKVFVDGETFLSDKYKEFSSNSNWLNFSDIVSEYGSIIGMLTFKVNPEYTVPLPEFSKDSPEDIKQRIKNSRFYGSHFSKNALIRRKMENLESDWIKAEQEYYKNMELAIEEHYKEYSIAIFDDQFRLMEISTNDAAKTRLEEFIRNSGKL